MNVQWEVALAYIVQVGMSMCDVGTDRELLMQGTIQWKTIEWVAFVDVVLSELGCQCAMLTWTEDQ